MDHGNSRRLTMSTLTYCRMSHPTGTTPVGVGEMRTTVELVAVYISGRVRR